MNQVSLSDDEDEEDLLGDGSPKKLAPVQSTITLTPANAPAQAPAESKSAPVAPAGAASTRGVKAAQATLGDHEPPAPAKTGESKTTATSGKDTALTQLAAMTEERPSDRSERRDRGSDRASGSDRAAETPRPAAREGGPQSDDTHRHRGTSERESRHEWAGKRPDHHRREDTSGKHKLEAEGDASRQKRSRVEDQTDAHNRKRSQDAEKRVHAGHERSDHRRNPPGHERSDHIRLAEAHGSSSPMLREASARHEDRSLRPDDAARNYRRPDEHSRRDEASRNNRRDDPASNHRRDEAHIRREDPPRTHRRGDDHSHRIHQEVFDPRAPIQQHGHRERRAADQEGRAPEQSHRVAHGDKEGSEHRRTRADERSPHAPRQRKQDDDGRMADTESKKHASGQADHSRDARAQKQQSTRDSTRRSDGANLSNGGSTSRRAPTAPEQEQRHDARDHFGPMVEAIYRNHAPDKLKDVPALLDKYSHDLPGMYERIFNKYQGNTAASGVANKYQGDLKREEPDHSHKPKRQRRDPAVVIDDKLESDADLQARFEKLKQSLPEPKKK